MPFQAGKPMNNSETRIGTTAAANNLKTSDWTLAAVIDHIEIVKAKMVAVAMKSIETKRYKAVELSPRTTVVNTR